METNGILLTSLPKYVERDFLPHWLVRLSVKKKSLLCTIKQAFKHGFTWQEL